MTEHAGYTEYEWHFKLDNEHEEDVSAADEALTAMVRSQLEALLKCVILTNKGENLRVTGFRLLDTPDQEHPILRGLRPVCHYPITARRSEQAPPRQSVARRRRRITGTAIAI